MQIWIFNPFDAIPGEDSKFRYWSLAEALVARGHAVVWWSSDFSHRTKTYRRSDIGDRRSELEDGKTESLGKLDCASGLSPLASDLPFELRLVKTPAYAKNVSLARIRSHRAWGQQLQADAIAAVDSGTLPKPDLILASTPPLEGPTAALALKQRFGCRVVTDVMDAWPDTLLQACPGWARGLGRLLLKSYERMLEGACLKSDAVSAQSHQFADYARAHGAKGAIHVCYLGGSRLVEPSDLPAAGHESGVRLIYLGAMGRSYDLKTLVEAVQSMRAAGRSVELLMVGDGPQRAALEALKVAGVRWTGYLQGEALHAELQAADLGVVPFIPESGVAVPYKVGDYLGAGLPVLSTIEGELAELLEAYVCGLTYSACEPASLVQAIEIFLSDPKKLQSAKQAALCCFDAKFDRERLYAAFAEWVETVC